MKFSFMTSTIEAMSITNNLDRSYRLYAKLDRLVLQAYGFNLDDDLLEKLLALNLELAAKEKSGEAIVGCWAPEQLPSERQK